MLPIQDSELINLIHEQKSPRWLNQVNQQPIVDSTFKGSLILSTSFFIIALTIGAGCSS
ncbi:MAG: hypothetical protein HRT53_03240 [Colwellia sp.]|nr:hypothetical protein [Colwellia sp.]